MNALDVAQGVAWLAQGGLLAYPTETVWGLGADACSQPAIGRLRRWKGRRNDAPLALLVDGLGGAEEAAGELTGAARELAERFWPGPLMLVVPSRRRYAEGVARGDGALGLRCSDHPLAAELARALRAAGIGPITSTSLNRSGEAPACRRDEAAALCAEAYDAPRLLAGECGGGAPSTVVDLSGAAPAVLRWGALERERLAPFVQEDSRR